MKDDTSYTIQGLDTTYWEKKCKTTVVVLYQAEASPHSGEYWKSRCTSAKASSQNERGFSLHFVWCFTGLSGLFSVPNHRSMKPGWRSGTRPRGKCSDTRSRRSSSSSWSRRWSVRTPWKYAFKVMEVLIIQLIQVTNLLLGTLSSCCPQSEQYSCQPVFISYIMEKGYTVLLSAFISSLASNGSKAQCLNVMSRLLCFLQLEKRDKMAADDGASGGFTKNKVRWVRSSWSCTMLLLRH